MKKFRISVLSIIILAYSNLLMSQNITLPRTVSYGAELHQTLGLSEIIVNYSRPRVTLNGKDRSGEIWGKLVHYGLRKISFGGQREIPWRAGANENTTIAFSDDVKVEGKALKAGKYGLHMIIHENNKATVIFSENTSSWGSFYYDESEDVLRVDVDMEDIHHTEVLTFEFVDMGEDYGVLALDWEEKRIPIKIEIDLHKIVLTNIRNELRGFAGFGWQGYQSAANYCRINNINHDEALVWIDKSINSNPNFVNLSTKGALLYQMGNKSQSFEITDQAAEIANNAQLNNLAYRLLGLGEVTKAVAYMELNVKRNPDDPNVYDSLGEGYVAAGRNKDAIKMFKKSLSMDPPDRVKNNSLKMLKELGAL